MFWAIMAAVESIKRSTASDRHRNPLSPRKDRDRAAGDEPPNPEFDFGPNSTLLAYTKRGTAERRFARVMLVLLLLALIPLGILVIALIWH